MNKDILSNIAPAFLSCKTPIIIAGPCSAETHVQTINTAQNLKTVGVTIFRAGLWKPRTQPGAFEGVGTQGLEWLSQVKTITGMQVATEVATAQHVEESIKAGIDVLWIGARTTTNPFAVQEIADALQGQNQITVLVKNPVTPDIDLWIGALQRILNSGVTSIGAIHRGFGAYGNHLYRNMPEWHLPIELHRRYPTLTILCDPSHMGGERKFIAPLSQQALDMGFDGLFIESHINPTCALSDAAQQITPQELGEILNGLIVRQKNITTDDLESLRRMIDACDDELIEVLNRRMAISREIGTFKKEHDMQVVQTNRFDTILKKRLDQAQQLGMNTSFLHDVMSLIHEESVRQQIEIISKE